MSCMDGVSDTGRTRYKGRTCETCLRFVFRRESIRSPVRKQENIQVRSRQIYHEDVKFYTIDNGMCVGQCEGSTLYEVAVDEPCADRACHQTLQIPPEYDGTVIGLHKNKKDLDLECKSATAAV